MHSCCLAFTKKPRLATLAFLLATLATGPAFGGAGPALPGANLESLLELARNQNPELAAQRYEAEAAGERVHSAGALPDPVFRTELRDITNQGSNASPNILPGRIGSTKYTFIQPLPFWGKRDLKREVAEAEASQAQNLSAATWSDLAARIKAAYAQYYALSRSLALTQELLDLTGSLGKIAQVRYAGGLVPQQDAIRAQTEQTALRGELVGMENERHHALIRLNALLRRPAMAQLAEPERLRPLPASAKLDYVALEDRLRARNPLLFAEAARVAAAEKNRELVYRNRYPDFSLGVSPIQTDSRINEWEVMLELNIPLQQKSRRAQEREAQALLSAAESRRDAAQNQLLAALSENLSTVETAQRIETLNQTSLLPQAELTFRSAQAGYENGKVDFATLIDAQRQIRKARLDILKAQTDAQIGLAEIERLLGEDL